MKAEKFHGFHGFYMVLKIFIWNFKIVMFKYEFKRKYAGYIFCLCVATTYYKLFCLKTFMVYSIW